MSAEFKRMELQAAVDGLTELFQQAKGQKERDRLQKELNEADKKLKNNQVLLG
ncbi:hypothetical protein EVB91_274 [Rhizobium phage RHph_I1_18]|nr:hypothetical protein EVB91_274 [Rhizobium phage RHph_I1_18]